MDYKLHYNNLIETRKQRAPVAGVYYEKHHIIMISMGGSDNKENLVLLTPREHFIAHWLLWRIYRNRQTSFAFKMMCTRINVSSRAYSEAKEMASKFTSLEKKELFKNKKNHPMFGRSHSEEAKKKIGDFQRSIGSESNPMFGRKGSNNPRSIPILQINKKSGKIIREWESATIASSLLNIAAQGINKNCKGYRKSVGGFIFKYKKEKC